jgi:hypothetical protein
MSHPNSANPYASPSTPAASPTIDFREAAVEESLLRIEAAPGRDPDELGLSLVLPADVDGFSRLRWIGRMMLVRLVLGIAGIVAGGILAATEAKLRATLGLAEWHVLTVAGICSLGGIGLLLTSVFFVRRAVRRGIGQRYEEARQHSNFRRPLCVGVEDCRTFTTMKIAPEDLAYVAFDAAHRRLILEGLLFRYVIQAADIVSVQQAAGAAATGTQIVFRVGRTVVGITLQFDSIWHEVKKQTIGAGRDPLLTPIMETFAGKTA